MMKQCTRCLESFPATLEFFAKNRKTLNSQCRKCIAEKTKIWSKQNPEKKAANAKKWAKANPEKCLQSQKKWLKANPEKKAESTKNWVKANPEKRAANARNWALANPEKRAAASNKRRALKAGNDHKPYTLQDVINMYGLNCHICNFEIDIKAERKSGKKGWQNGLHIDHLIPISKGGADNLINVRPSHALCNLKKSSKLETATAIPQLEHAMISKIEKR
jgi:predicted  nucleic acid-binding Zn-ribbon protein